MNIGTKIKRLREQKNISQTSLADKLGIAQNTLGLIENGETKKIDFLLIEKVCRIFEVNFNYFIDDVRHEQVNKPNVTGYLSENQHIEPSEKLVEQLIHHINKQTSLILELKEFLFNSKRNNQ